MFKEIIGGGLINEQRVHPKDYILGAPSLKTLHFKDGHGWADFAPTNDFQTLVDGDSNMCVTDSVINGYEYAVEKARYDNQEIDLWLKENGYIDENDNVKFNNRIVAVGSGTDPNGGNTVTNVVEFIRKYGLAPQSAYPWDNSMTKKEFYNLDTFTDEVKNAGKIILEVLDFAHEWLPHTGVFSQTHTSEQLINGLKYGCVRVSVDGNYEIDKNGYIAGKKGLSKLYNWNHSVLLRDYKQGQYWEVHDHYNRQIIKFNWEYPVGNGKVLYIVLRNQIKKNLSGQFADYGKSIFIYGEDGKYKNVPLAFEDGDVFRALFGQYSKSKPRVHLTEIPKEIKIIKVV